MNPNKQIIILIGPPGVGKTSVGKLLSERLACDFIDTDHEIERQEGKSVSEIFVLQGEEFFRHLEKGILDKLMSCVEQKNNRVISVGGGMPVWSDNFDRLSQLGKIVSLNAGINTLMTRLGDAKRRPLLQTNDSLSSRIETILKDRSAIYAKAPYQINTDLLSIEDVAEQILELLKTEQ